jgi:hypothetical protein
MLQKVLCSTCKQYFSYNKMPVGEGSAVALAVGCGEYIRGAPYPAVAKYSVHSGPSAAHTAAGCCVLWCMGTQVATSTP